jgi:hypothetical protein
MADIIKLFFLISNLISYFHMVQGTESGALQLAEHVLYN